MGPGFESQPVHKACHESDRLFCFKDAKGAKVMQERWRHKLALWSQMDIHYNERSECSREQIRNKKQTKREAVR